LEYALVDLFNEVDEELRSDQAISVFRRVAPWVTGVLAVVLIGYLGFWGYKTFQDRNQAAASLAYQKGVDALQQGDSAGALADFEQARKAGAPGYKTLALMQEGDLRMTAGKPDDAVKLFDQAASAAPNQVLGDLARLKAALALVDTAPLPQLKARLDPLMAAKRPFALYAKEAMAMGELMAGKTDDAKRDLSVLQLSLGVPEEMRQRAQIAEALIDHGDAAAAVAAVKTAATMPPLPPMNVAPASPGADDQGAAQQPPAGAAQ
jgi:hypothetical protein